MADRGRGQRRPTPPRWADGRAGRLGRQVAATTLLLGLVVAIQTVTGDASGAADPAAAAPSAGAATGDTEPWDLGGDELLVRGGELFQANCAACHGTRGEGGQGEGVLAGPRVDDIDVAYMDLTIRTGRMPIAEPSVGVHADRLSADERDAIVAWTQHRFELPGAIPAVTSGDASRGQELYVRNCAACHGAAGDGGIAGAGVNVPPLVGLDGIAIASATRVGPFEMPGFDAAVLSDEAIDDIIGYLDAVDATPRTLAGIREVDQVAAAIVAFVLAMLAGVVLLVVARVRRWHHREAEGVRSLPPFEPRR